MSQKNTRPNSRTDRSRLISLEGTDNFRDIGGYLTEDGQQVRWGMLYRSGHLGRLSDSDLSELQRLNIRKVTDFRGPVEKDDDPNRLPDSTDYTERPIDVAGSDLKDAVKSLILGEKGMSPDEYLLGVNRLFVREYTSVFREWIHELVENEEAVPQVYHCTAGKDRTGFASALILRILGVACETILNDYLLSNTFMAESTEVLIRKITRRAPVPGAAERIRPLFGIKETYLKAAFEAIDEDWGNFDTFVNEALGLDELDITVLKDRFLV